MTIEIRQMLAQDYTQIKNIWASIPGLKLEAADSEEGIARYLEKNPSLSFVACNNKEIIGTVLCGEDGRRGYLQHLCVTEKHRKQGVGQKLLEAAIEQFEQLALYEIRIFVFKDNDIGNEFWKKLGWTIRNDIYVQSYQLNKNTLKK